LAIEVLNALGERVAMIAATEQRAGAALQAMITEEHLAVSGAVQWCAGAISHREAARLRQLAGQAQDRAR
jgi:hypothetical protein